MPLDDGKRYWLLDEQGDCTELAQPGCLYHSVSKGAVPLRKEGNQYWLDVDIQQSGPHQEAKMMAPLEGEEAYQYPSAAFNFEPFDPRDFEEQEDQFLEEDVPPLRWCSHWCPCSRALCPRTRP